MPSLEQLEAVAHGAPPPPLEHNDRQRIAAGRAVVEEAVRSGSVVYGVTTGFGQLSSVRIDAADAAQLQVNLLRSHAVGSGEPLAQEVVRGMLLALSGSLRRGHSGVRVELVDLLLAPARARRHAGDPRAAGRSAPREISPRSPTSGSC